MEHTRTKSTVEEMAVRLTRNKKTTMMLIERAAKI